MQDWDRLVLLLIGAGVAGYSGYGGWQSWRRRERQAAVGALLLAAVTAALPAWLFIASP